MRGSRALHRFLSTDTYLKVIPALSTLTATLMAPFCYFNSHINEARH